MNNMSKEYRLEQVSIRLVKDLPILSKTRICSPRDAISVLAEYFSDYDKEIVCVLNLKSDGTPINFNIVSIGTINETVMSPREVLKSAILTNAYSIIIMHNHPSGNIKPSKVDCVQTDKMIKATELMGVKLIDHIIIGNGNENYFSFKEKGFLYIPEIEYEKNYCNINFVAEE